MTSSYKVVFIKTDCKKETLAFWLCIYMPDVSPFPTLQIYCLFRKVKKSSVGG